MFNFLYQIIQVTSIVYRVAVIGYICSKISVYFL